MKNEKGFTLVEMMIVMLIIAVLLIIMIPSAWKNQQIVQDKGCEAFLKTVEAQAQAYRIDENKMPTLEQLKGANYIKETTCPNGKEVSLSADGQATVPKTE